MVIMVDMTRGYHGWNEGIMVEMSIIMGLMAVYTMCRMTGC